MSLARFLILIVSLAVSIAGVEMVFRFFNSQLLSHSLSYSSNDHLWNSGISGIYKWREFEIPLLFNEQGERDERNHPIRRPEGKKRVLVLGDSITYGWPLVQEGMYLSQLRKILPEWEFINCSAVTLNIVQLLELYRNRCSAYEVDLVISQLTLMDRPSVPAMMFGSQLGKDHIENSILYDANGEKSLKQVQLGEFGLPERTMDEESRHFLEALFRPLLPGYYHLNVVRWLEHNLVWPWRYSFRTNRRLLDFGGEAFQKSVPDWKLEAKIIERFKEEVTKAGAHYMVLIIPNALGHFLFSSRPDFPIAGELPRQASEKEMVKEALTNLTTQMISHKIDFLNLATSWPEPAEEYFLISKNDIHPSEKGHQWIAKRLASHLKARGTSY